MECFNCKTVMECYDDVNYVSVRIDWLECPKCESQAEIVYNTNDNSIKKLSWYINK